MAPDLDDPGTGGRLTLERFMRAMFTQLITAVARSLRSGNLSVAEIAALHLVDHQQQMRIGDLAERLDIDLPGASRIVSRLVSEGLIERRDDPADRRARILSLSAAGRELIDQTSRERVDAAVAAAANMPGQVKDTVGLALQQLIDREATQRGNNEK